MKQRNFILTLLGILLPMLIQSQDCPGGELELTSQDDVNAFAQLFPDCTELNSSLLIEGDIVDLSPLTQVVSIEGSLNISETGIENFNGLDQLEIVVGDFLVSSNSELESCQGLGSLTEVGGLRFIDNEELTSFEGMESLTKIDYPNDDELFIEGGFLVSQNPSLVSFNGLNNLSSIDGEYSGGFKVSENNDLLNFMGLENLTSLNGDITIDQNASLTSFAGLENLVPDLITLEVSENDDLVNMASLNFQNGLRSAFIRDNPVLESLAGLEGVTEITNQFRINRNDALSDISAIANTDLSGVFLFISDNPMLEACSYSSICEYLVSDDVDLDLSDNATGCNSQLQILAGCEEATSGLDDFTDNEQLVFALNGSLIFDTRLLDECQSCLLSIVSTDGKVIFSDYLVNKLKLPSRFSLSTAIVVIEDNRQVYSKKIFLR